MKRRNTPAKQSILAMFEQSGFALSQDMIEQKMNGETDRVTIYRILNSFCEDGITHRIASDDGKNYYALCKNCDQQQHDHDHFHFKCLHCQKVECLKEHITIKLPEGYKTQSINCWISGYCSTCS
jgi:Fur family ferric uptake transcriptional regulator